MLPRSPVNHARPMCQRELLTHLRSFLNELNGIPAESIVIMPNLELLKNTKKDKADDDASFGDKIEEFLEVNELLKAKPDTSSDSSLV